MKGNISKKVGMGDNNTANAVRGKLLGAAVRADDVSPFARKLDVRVSSKNLFDISKVKTNEAGDFEAKKGYGLINNNDGTLTVYTYDSVSSVVAKAPNTLRDYAPNLKVGQTYTFNANTTGVSTHIYFDEAKLSWGWGKPLTITEEILASKVRWYAAPSASETKTAIISNIQIEQGTTATTYTPYVTDDTEITITSIGKNLLPYPTSYKTNTLNGITCTDNGDGTWTLNGTATAEAVFAPVGTKDVVPLKQGTYTLGCNIENSFDTIYLQGKLVDGDKNINISGAKSNTFTITDSNRFRYNIRVKEGFTCNNLVVKPQLELDSVATEFEPYVLHEELITTIAEGAELNSIAPNMTILSDTNGVTLECSYSKDTNKIIEQLTHAIISLGGNI